MGTERKYTPEQMAEAIVAARGILSQAARDLKCDRKTVTNYVNAFPECKAATEQARERFIDDAENALAQLVEDREHKDHFGAVRFALRTIGKRRGFVERQEITGADGSGVVINFKPAEEKDGE